MNGGPLGSVLLGGYDTGLLAPPPPPSGPPVIGEVEFVVMAQLDFVIQAIPLFVVETR